MNAKELLLSLDACHEAIMFSEGKTIKQAWEECPRGDWMLWIYPKLFPNELRKLTLAKAYCANTVRGLMHDERSRYAIDVAIKFGYGFATPGKLKESADAAAYAAAAAYADADADAAAAAAACAASADAVSAVAAYAAAASADAKKQNQLLTADICRQFLDISSIYES